jgi:hypothetical protein
MRTAILVATVITLLAGPARQASACLGEARLFDDALLEARSPADYERVLKEFGSCSIAAELSRSPDVPLLRLLLHASKAQAPAELVRKVLVKYRCAYSQRSLPEYREVLAYIQVESASEICDTQYLSSLAYVVPEHGVVVRAGPSESYPREATRAHDELVELLGTDGKWSKVRAPGIEGFILSALLAPY